MSHPTGNGAGLTITVSGAGRVAGGVSSNPLHAVDFCQKPPYGGPVHTTTIQLPKDLHARLVEFSRRTKRSKVELIRVALDKEFESQFVSAYDGLADLAGTVKLDFDARDHKKAFRKAMLKRHAKDNR